VEIARTGAAVEGAALAARLDVEADRAALFVIHAGVHREAQPGGARAQFGLERGEPAQGAAPAVEEQGDLVAAAVVAADGEKRAFEPALLAGGGDGPGRHSGRVGRGSAGGQSEDEQGEAREARHWSSI
jgi:hypothetical protein